MQPKNIVCICYLLFYLLPEYLAITIHSKKAEPNGLIQFETGNYYEIEIFPSGSVT